MNIKERRNETKVYDLVTLAADLGFTPVRVSSQFISLEEHDSVMINITRNTFKQYSTGAFGDPVAFCMSLGVEKNSRFKNLEYAIQYVEEKIKLNPDNRIEIKNRRVRTEKKDLILPLHDFNNNKIYYYMENRCIDRDIVDEFIANKWLYQEKAHHNLVFVSYKNEKPVFITEKGIIQESRFMKEYPDNDYDHCFFVDYNSNTLVVTEAIVDMMSLMTLNKECYKECSYLSINSTTKDNAIYKQIQNHPEIKNVMLRFDNDEAGIKAMKRIKERLQEEFPQIHVDVEYPPAEKDWNDYLVYSVYQKEKINEYTIVF
ncbi:toprim domain-containing protein [Thomasclavelia spiroformis]|jgi:5S rRNA maturation endonuclease (ribonuclease M5)|uniref:toprim domain-containing protein n=1 Tax=Thomasclavelia spiroformis TaxID=29348 RepID=UPI00241C1A05|nr:toprim domain-containing protein [Thomasclavelia spiroformis]